MSDRHAAEKLFAELLYDYRAEVLPMVAENWNLMTSLEQENLTNMNNFFCGLHYLIGLADCAEETLKLWERECELEVSSTSGTQRLIRTACKAFHHQGSQQCGSSILFRSYLRKEAGIHKIPLARFVGNRFNIIFYDAAGIFFLRNHMIRFIETVHGNSANLLLQAVLSDLKNPVLIAGCRALGLIDKLVTGPLWRQLRESSTTVLKASEIYSEIKVKFDSWSCNAHNVITGSEVLGEQFVIHTDDDVFKGLITTCSESDLRTQEVLQLIFKGFSVTTQRLLLDHLPGGMYHTATVSRHITCSDEIRSVPTTNVSPERDFAILDRLLREKPNATMVALESMMIYRTNKTALWLQGKNRKDTHRLLKAARARVPQVKEMDKSRRELIKARQEEAFLKKQKEVARKEKKRLNEKAKLIDEVEKVHGGLWKSSTEIEDGLKAIKNKTDKVKAIKLQINYRNRILCQTHDNKSLFKFSSNRKALSIEQLKNNLHELVSSFNHSHSPHTEPHERCDQDPACSSLEADPNMLVGKRIRHRFEDDGKLTWFDGEVIAEVNENQFEVIYDGDDTVYCFELLDDMRNGDLIVC